MREDPGNNEAGEIHALLKFVKIVLRLSLALLCLLLLAAAVLELGIRFLTPEALAPIPMDRPTAIYAAEGSREHPHSRGATNAWKIAIVGDSATFGSGNHRFDRFSSRLEWLLNLNDSAPPAEVEVFAKPTATYQQEKLVRKALAWSPRILILSIHLNDTEDWSNAAPFVGLRRLMSDRAAPRFLRPLLRKSALLKVAWKRWQEHRQLKLAKQYYDILYDASYTGLARFKGALAQYRDMCREQGVVLFAIIQPLLSWDARPGHYPFEDKHRIISSVCSELGIPCTDTLEYFRYTAPIRNVDIPLADPHPSEIAHRIIADAIFNSLLESGILPRRYIPKEQVDRALIRNWRRKFEALEIPAPRF